MGDLKYGKGELDIFLKKLYQFSKTFSPKIRIEQSANVCLRQEQEQQQLQSWKHVIIKPDRLLADRGGGWGVDSPSPSYCFPFLPDLC